MHMTGGQAFIGKTGRRYPKEAALEIEQPDVREALINGWEPVSPGDYGVKKGTELSWKAGSGVAIGNEIDGRVLVEHQGHTSWISTALIEPASEPAESAG